MSLNYDRPVTFITMASEPSDPRTGVRTIDGSFHFTEENRLLFQEMYDKLDKMLQCLERRENSFKAAKSHAQIAAELRQSRSKAREVAANELNDDALNVYHLFDEMSYNQTGNYNEELEGDFHIYRLFDEMPLNQIEDCDSDGDSLNVYQLFDETPQRQIKSSGKVCEVCDTLNEQEEDPFGLSNLFDEMHVGEIRRYDTVYEISQLFDEMPEREIKKYNEVYEIYQLFDEMPQSECRKYDEVYEVYWLFYEMPQREIRKYDELYEFYHLFDEKAHNETRICDDICEFVNEEYGEDSLDVYTLFAELPDGEVRMYDEVCDVGNEKIQDANEIHQVLEERDKQCTRIGVYSRITDEYVYHLSHFDKNSVRPDGLFMEPTLGEIMDYGKLAKHDWKYCVYIPTHDFENSLPNCSCTQDGVTHKFVDCYRITWDYYFALQHQILKFKSWEKLVELEYLKRHVVTIILTTSTYNGAMIYGCYWGGWDSFEKWASGVILGDTVVGLIDEHLWVGRSNSNNQKDWLPLHPKVCVWSYTVAIGEYTWLFAGNSYGYYNLIFSWLEIIGNNYSSTLDGQLIMGVMSLRIKMLFGHAANRWNDGLNMQLLAKDSEFYRIPAEIDAYANWFGKERVLVATSVTTNLYINNYRFYYPCFVTIYVMVAHYNSQLTTDARTYFINGNAKENKVYALLFEAQGTAILVMDSRTIVSPISETTIVLVKREAPELILNLAKFVKKWTGLELHKSSLDIGANEAMLRTRIVFNDSLRFKNQQTKIGNGKRMNLLMTHVDAFVATDNSCDLATFVRSKASNPIIVGDDEIETLYPPTTSRRRVREYVIDMGWLDLFLKIGNHGRPILLLPGYGISCCTCLDPIGAGPCDILFAEYYCDISIPELEAGGEAYLKGYLVSFLVLRISASVLRTRLLKGGVMLESALLVKSVKDNMRLYC